MHPSLRRIQRLSRILSASCVLFIVTVPILVIGYWVLASPEQLAMNAGLPFGSLMLLHPWQRVGGALISLVPIVLLNIALLNARACFRQFAQGSFFTMEAVSRLRRFAGWICASVVTGFIARTALSAMLTFSNPEGQRHLAIGIESNQLFTLFIAGMVWLIAAVMTRAVALADENAQFV